MGHVLDGNAHLLVNGVGHILVGYIDLVGLVEEPIDNYDYIVNLALNKLS